MRCVYYSYCIACKHFKCTFLLFTKECPFPMGESEETVPMSSRCSPGRLKKGVLLCVRRPGTARWAENSVWVYGGAAETRKMTPASALSCPQARDKAGVQWSPGGLSGEHRETPGQHLLFTSNFYHPQCLAGYVTQECIVS